MRNSISISLNTLSTFMTITFFQAKEKSFQNQQEVTQELDDNYTELKNHINGDLLTENPAVSQSAFGPNRYTHYSYMYICTITVFYYRVIPDRWKGMSPSQVAEIQLTQQLQCEEKQVRD